MAPTYLPGRPADFCADCLAGNHHDHLIGMRGGVRGLLCWRTVAEEPRDYICRCVQPLHAERGGDDSDEESNPAEGEEAEGRTAHEEGVLVEPQLDMTVAAPRWPPPFCS